MLIFPAIDLLDNKVVRLYQGKRESAKVYSERPVEIAEQWISQGARYLHIVDLNASFNDGNNLGVLKNIASLDVELQVGGGIRTLEKAHELIDLGVKNIIIGTKALDAVFLDKILDKFRKNTAVSVDSWEGKVKTAGWRESTDLDCIEFIGTLAKKGVPRVIYTDISRDGALTGPAMGSIKKLSGITGPQYIISGGMAEISDITAIKEQAPFVSGVILGKSLYEKKINLEKALKLFSGKE